MTDHILLILIGIDVASIFGLLVMSIDSTVDSTEEDF